MSRWLSAMLFVAYTAFADDSPKKQQQKKEPAKQQEEAPPPDEDAAAAAKQYAFNPLQAQKEVRVGNYYFKKGSYRAAAQRFREATKWNPGSVEAWLRLAETDEKQNDAKGACQAYSKYVELQQDAKSTAEIKKKLERMKCS